MESYQEPPLEQRESIEKSEKGQYLFSDSNLSGSPVVFSCNALTKKEAEDRFRANESYCEEGIIRGFISE
jgi:hypothetical protein